MLFRSLLNQAVVRIIIGPSDRRFFDGEKFLIKAGEFKEMTCFGGFWFWFSIRVNVSAEGHPWYHVVFADLF